MSQSPLYQPTNTYVRNLNLLEEYANTIALAYAKKHNVEFDKALAYVKSEMREGGKLEYKDPVMTVNIRPGIYQDKQRRQLSFLKYLDIVQDRGWILAPNLVSCENPSKFEAPLVKFQVQLTKERNKYKKMMFICSQNNDTVGEAVNNKTQNNKKTKSNSISGASVDKHNPLANETQHSLLTSTCGTTTTISNIITERVIASNRFYFSEDVAISNLWASVRLISTDKVKECISTYGLKLPTKQDVLNLVKECISLYVFKPKLELIERHLDMMDQYDYAKIFFSYDLNGLIKINPELVRNFYNDLTLIGNRDRITSLSIEETKSLEKSALSYNESLALTLSGRQMKGKNLSSLDKDDPKLFGIYGFFLKNINATFNEKYYLLLNTFFSGDLGANMIHDFYLSLRKVVNVSDTDSTNWTNQDIIKWFFNRDKILFTEEEDFVRESTAFLVSNVVYHQLAKMSKSIGVREDKLHVITMKPEYSFPVMFATTKSKHYGMLMSAKEGNILNKLKLDIKGVGLKSSTYPDYVNDFTQTYWEVMLGQVVNEGKRFTIEEVLSQPAYIEHRTLDMLAKGKPIGLRTGVIKSPESYKLLDQAPVFFKQKLWNQVFGPKYGVYETTPIPIFDVPVMLENKSAILAWLDSIKDPQVKCGLQGMLMGDWNNYKKVSNIGIPRDYLLSHSLPEELLPIIDIPKIIKTTSVSMYMFLETLGIYLPKTKKGEIIVFAKDIVDYETAKKHIYPKGKEIVDKAFGFE